VSRLTRATLGPVPADQDPTRPLDPPMTPFAVGGIVAWAVAGLALLPLRGWLDAHGHQSWLKICLAGFLFGFLGLAVMLRHDANRRRRRYRAPTDSTSPSS
jgi:uncharacterized membrane protein (DUF4010 family)